MKPILFNTEMVQAILEGRKTVTRRVAKGVIEFENGYYNALKRGEWSGAIPETTLLKEYAPFKVNDVLYVRETWCKWYCYDCGQCDGDGSCDYGKPLYDTEREEWFCYCYRANGDADPFDNEHWKPSIHMPKEAARIFLRVTDVRVERLQDMTREDILKEGLEDFCKKCSALFSECDTCMNEGALESDFIELWNSTIKKDQIKLYGWESNPYVWVIEFKDISEEVKRQQS